MKNIYIFLAVLMFCSFSMTACDMGQPSSSQEQYQPDQTQSQPSNTEEPNEGQNDTDAKGP